MVIRATRFLVPNTARESRPRRVTPAIKRQMRRLSPVGPVIGYIKNEHRMGRTFLAHTQGDAINAILAAAGYNFSLLLRCLRRFCGS